MKHKILVSTATLMIFLVVVVGIRSSFGQPAAASNDQTSGGWEYLVVQGGTVNLTAGDGGSMRKADGAFSREFYPLERNMDKLGAKGWELVAVTGSPGDPICYFKRKK